MRGKDNAGKQYKQCQRRLLLLRNDLPRGRSLEAQHAKGRLSGHRLFKMPMQGQLPLLSKVLKYTNCRTF